MRLWGGESPEKGLSESPHELVLKARRGDSAAFADLIRLHERAALSVAYAIARDAQMAGDIVQDAFLRAWEHIAELQDAARFAPWLLGIVRNAAISQRRRHSRVVDASPAERVGSDGDPARAMERQDTRRMIAEALDELDELSRSAVVLRYFDGLSSRQIGELLDLSPAAVDMRLMRAS